MRMRTCATQRQGELNRRRVRPWQAVAAAAVTLAALAMVSAAVPRSPARASVQAAAASASAPVPVVGVQDSWVNSCDKGSTPDFNPKGSDPAVPAVDGRRWG